MAGERTEKATPKKRGEARKKGQVARSVDLNGAVVLVAGLVALSAFGPAMLHRVAEATVAILDLVKTPQVVDQRGLGWLFASVGEHVALAVLPVVGICAVAAVVVNVLQVGFKPGLGSLKPDPKRLNPVSGFKHLFGVNSVVETVKSLFKVGLVGAIVALAVFPKLQELSALVGTPAGDLVPQLGHAVLGVAQRAAAAYLLIALADMIWQRHRFEKNLRMDKQEVKDEHKQTELPAEIRGAQRRRAMELARARMMDAVPTADVVVVNPTHFSVALRYDSSRPAPVVVAKGTDHLALRIREVAREHGVAVVPDPPLARTLHATVDLNQMIPEELFAAVAQLLAYVYRVAGARRALAGASA
ncbi:MAG TPA: flagellar biosynthesis protein FlhB [Solirubrobacteraceae bacterium]|jgi:flagellar biosynthetic protein FlhB